MSIRPFRILGIEHVGIALDTLDGLSAIFSEILGLEFVDSEKVKDQKVITDIYQTGNSKLEFLQATDSKSPISNLLQRIYS